MRLTVRGADQPPIDQAVVQGLLERIEQKIRLKNTSITTVFLFVMLPISQQGEPLQTRRDSQGVPRTPLLARQVNGGYTQRG
jgi:hypothetical protein